MHDFPEHTDLGRGYSWTATFDSHDYARMFSFYFTLSIQRGGATVAQLPVDMFDRSYGDRNCAYTDDEMRAYVREQLHSEAQQYLADRPPLA